MTSGRGPSAVLTLLLVTALLVIGAAGGIVLYWSAMREPVPTPMLAPDPPDPVPPLDRQDRERPARPSLSPRRAAELQAAGLADPQRDLIRDLRARADLIPFQGVLGGTMFFVETETYVLTDRWVLATFEDGHIRGQMILEYHVAEDGQISWTVLDAYLE